MRLKTYRRCRSGQCYSVRQEEICPSKSLQLAYHGVTLQVSGSAKAEGGGGGEKWWCGQRTVVVWHDT